MSPFKAAPVRAYRCGRPCSALSGPCESELAPNAEAHLSLTERALVSAVGKALAILSAALQSGPAFQRNRFADMLALFSTIAREDDAL